MEVVCNIKAPLIGKKTAPPRIVRIKYRIEGNKQQQSLQDFFTKDFFKSLFFPKEITLALFFPEGNSIQRSCFEFPEGKNKASVISWGKKRLQKNLEGKNHATLCCSLFYEIVYFICTIQGAVFFRNKGALWLLSSSSRSFFFPMTWFLMELNSTGITSWLYRCCRNDPGCQGSSGNWAVRLWQAFRRFAAVYCWVPMC